MTEATHGYHSFNDISLFVSQYRPPNKVSGVTVIAQPFGPEYMHCKAAVRQLANALCESGQVTLVFDWPGYGQSSGQLPDMSNPKILSDSLKSVLEFASQMHQNVSLIGLRSSSLILHDLLESTALHKLILWYPVTQGKAFIRDVQLIDHALNVGIKETHIEAGGYPISIENVADFEQLNMKSLTFNQCSSALVIHSPEVKRLSFLKALQTTVPDVTVMTSNALSSMAKQAELSQVPTHDIQLICNAFQTSAETRSNDIALLTSQENAGYIEQPVIFGADNLQGLLTLPNGEKATQCLLIPNTGSGHSVGPNGLHTALARHLANWGIATLRFDLRHLGNSGQPKSNSNEAYAAHAKYDLESAVVFAQSQKFEKISLFGICSGAYSVFSYLRETKENQSIDQAVLVNANTLNWREGDNPYIPDSATEEMEAEHHANQAKDINAWLNLLRSPGKWIRIFRSAFGMIYSKLKRSIERKEASDFEMGCQKALSRTNRLHLIFSPDDIGIQTIGKQFGEVYENYKSNGQITYLRLSSGDHTFTELVDRKALIDSVCRLFQKGPRDNLNQHTLANRDSVESV